MRGLKPPHVIMLSFFGAIAVGTMLLSLPQATQGSSAVPLVDRIFTATSAACVTGLIVKEPASWAPFGQMVIRALFQIGGLGIMTFSTLFVFMLGRKISIRGNLTVKGALGQYGITSLKSLLLHVTAIVFFFEALGRSYFSCAGATRRAGRWAQPYITLYSTLYPHSATQVFHSSGRASWGLGRTPA